MKSTEVYKEARQVLAPWCKQQGFKRIPGGMLGWVKHKDNKYVVFWLQCKQSGWDYYAGSSFVVEFQFSPSPRIGAYGADCVRDRLPHFLTEEELGRVREMQNRVIGKLPQPADDYFVLQLEERVVRGYLDMFKPVEQPYAATDDIW